MDVVGQVPFHARERALSMDGPPMHHHHTIPTAIRSPNGLPSGPPPMLSPGANAAAFAIARSPPKAKNTSHVPCKFFPYGTCQAGNACQFSHDLGSISQTAPCKYFAKGSCKFGQNCALAHILQDGRVVNKAPPPLPLSAPRATTIAQQRRVGHLNAALQQSPTSPFPPMQGNSDLYGLAEHNEHGGPFPGPTSPSVRVSQHNNDPYSPFGSPHATQFPASPSRGGLSALDAPLPGSFDSQGISQAARHGPFASSVPPRFGFGFESPPSSLLNGPKQNSSNLPLRDVRESPNLGDTTNLASVLHGLGTSPQNNESLSFNKRPLHSERYAASRPILSSSLDTRPSRLGLEQSQSDEDSDDGVGEDLLPSSLHDLLPQERLRRPSRSVVDETPSGFFATSPRRGFSTSNNTPIERPGNLSPIASSPSRYSAMWASRPAGSRKSENEPSVSAFGHVGSPLRPSALRTSSPLASTSPSSSGAFTPRTPNKTNQSNLSILTKELQRSKLTDASAKQSPLSLIASQNMHQDEESARAEQKNSKSASTNGTKRNKEKSDDETVFSMEDEEGNDGAASTSGSSKAPARTTQAADSQEASNVSVEDGTANDDSKAPI